MLSFQLVMLKTRVSLLYILHSCVFGWPVTVCFCLTVECLLVLMLVVDLVITIIIMTITIVG